MLLLAVDTSGKHGSIALAQCGPEENCRVLEVVAPEGGTFSAQLVPQIAVLLAKHGFGKHDIGALAVVSGPGSFTGLRIGLAAVKALAEVLAKPIAAVSLLEVIALAGRSQGKVLAVMDAGRGEIYAGEYEVNGHSAELNSERLLSQAELVQSAQDSKIVTADRRLAELVLGAGYPVEQVELPRSDATAVMGWRKILAGEIISPEDLDANYIRRSSEIFSQKQFLAANVSFPVTKIEKCHRETAYPSCRVR